LEINRNASDIDIFSLRLSCRALYTLLHDTKPPYDVDQSTILDLKNTLLRESFLRGCDLERVIDVRENFAMCHFCRASHPRQAFTSQELAKPPEKRSCYCKSGAIWLCPHQSYKFEELQNLPYFQTHKRNRFNAREPNLCLHLPDQYRMRGSSAQIRPYKEGHRISWSFDIHRSLISESSLQDFHDLIARSGGCFCPHLRPEVVWLSLTAERSLCRDSIKIISEQKKIRCVASGCHTEIFWSYGGRTPNRCEVVRYFSIKRADDFSYLAQLVH